jgi:DNA-binding MarR family transcriptional regulator
VINRLTPNGDALIDRLQEGKRARLIAALDRLSPDDLDMLARGLTELRRAMGDT